MSLPKHPCRQEAEFHVLDRQAAIESVRLIREQVAARIASLANTP
jgi:hypothetical protein